MITFNLGFEQARICGTIVPRIVKVNYARKRLEEFREEHGISANQVGFSGCRHENERFYSRKLHNIAIGGARFRRVASVHEQSQGGFSSIASRKVNLPSSEIRQLRSSKRPLSSNVNYTRQNWKAHQIRCYNTGLFYSQMRGNLGFLCYSVCCRIGAHQSKFLSTQAAHLDKKLRCGELS